MPSPAHSRTTAKPGPTIRTRWPPFTRVRNSSTRRQYSPTSNTPAVPVCDPASLTRPRLPHHLAGNHADELAFCLDEQRAVGVNIARVPATFAGVVRPAHGATVEAAERPRSPG